MAKGDLGRAIRFAIKSHEDSDLLCFAVKSGARISPRIGKGIIDHVFDEEMA